MDDTSGRTTNALLKYRIDCMEKNMAINFENISKKLDQIIGDQADIKSDLKNHGTLITTNEKEIEKLRSSSTMKEIIISVGTVISGILAGIGLSK